MGICCSRVTLLLLFNAHTQMHSLRHILQLGVRAPYVFIASSRVKSVAVGRTISDHAARWLSSAAPSTVQRMEVSEDKKSVSLLFEGGQEHAYHAVWLRHMCRYFHCLACGYLNIATSMNSV